MFNFQMLGFAVILAVVGLGADYYQQSLKAELEPGEMSAGAYFQTISGRFSDFQAEKAAKVEEKERKSRVKAGARPYLPEAPEGWTRREWAAGDNSRISTPPREPSKAEKKMLAANKLLRNMAAASEKNAAEALNSQTWVYERGDEIVSVRARFTKMPKGKSITSNAMTMVIGNISAMAVMEGWGVIQGVAYGKPSSFGDNSEKHYETLNAVIGFGDEVRLDVRTNTSDAATREILSRIDYDGLNALLPRPLAHVGSGADEVAPGQEVALAERMIEIRDDLIQKRTRAAEAWLHAATSHEDAMTLALRQTGLDIEGSMGKADADLERVMQEIEAQGEAGPEEHAELETETAEEPVQEASNDTAREVVPQAAGDEKALVSKRLPDDKIKKLQALSGAERTMAMMGLKVSVRKFEEENGLPKGACEFSMTNYRVECSAGQKQAQQAESSGGLFGLLAKGGKDEEPAAPAKPRRLKLSGGSSCLKNAMGGFCNN